MDTLENRLFRSMVADCILRGQVPGFAPPSGHGAEPVSGQAERPYACRERLST